MFFEIVCMLRKVKTNVLSIDECSNIFRHSMVGWYPSLLVAGYHPDGSPVPSDDANSLTNKYPCTQKSTMWIWFCVLFSSHTCYFCVWLYLSCFNVFLCSFFFFRVFVRNNSYSISNYVLCHRLFCFRSIKHLFSLEKQRRVH